MSNHTKREEILFAAARIITNKSVSSFTLQNVAKEANVSKGGLLYHFPNKEEIIKSMLEVPIDHYYNNLMDEVKADKINDGKWCRAYAKKSFMIPENMKLLWISGLISALSINPSLLNPMKEKLKIWQKNIENDGIDPIKATTIRLVADGLWFMDLFDISIINSSMREKLLTSLVNSSQE